VTRHSNHCNRPAADRLEKAYEVRVRQEARREIAEQTSK
jgi:hypothetical protein